MDDAEVRFPTVNDIAFPNTGNLNESLYDMSPPELAAHFQQGAEGNSEAICPTCPELDAFKLMLYAIQDKGWIATGKTVRGHGNSQPERQPSYSFYRRQRR
jgi:hypothetical protein